MNRSHSGLTTAQNLLLLASAGVAVAIVVWVASKIGKGQPDMVEFERLRRVYAAVSLYQIDHDGAYPLGLDQLSRDLRSDEDLLSPLDPLIGQTGPFPRDPGLPDGKETSKLRISFLFLPAHIRAGKLPAKVLKDWATNPAAALLVSPWHGKVVMEANGSAQVTGRILRTRFDGSTGWFDLKATASLSDSAKMFGP